MSEGSDGGGEAVGGVEDDEENKQMPRYERSLGEYIENVDENAIVMDDENGLPKTFPTGTKWYHWGLEIAFNPISIVSICSTHICFLKKRDYIIGRRGLLFNRVIDILHVQQRRL